MWSFGVIKESIRTREKSAVGTSPASGVNLITQLIIILGQLGMEYYSNMEIVHLEHRPQGHHIGSVCGGPR